MPDFLPSSPAERAEAERSIADVVRVLRDLHRRAYPEQDHEYRTRERILSELNPTNRRNVLQILRETRRRLRRKLLQEDGSWTDERVATIYSALAERKLNAALAARWHDHVLSSPGHPIQYQRYGMFQLKQEVEHLVMDGTPQQSLRTVAWLSFDVNGLKSMIDCTNHHHACEYLQHLARLFLDRKGPTRTWLERDLHCRVTPLTAGGDEFAVLLRGEKPFTRELLESIIRRYQQEVMEHGALRSSLNFENPDVLRKFGGLKVDRRKGSVRVPTAEQVQKLAEIRKALPDQFIPTISGGAATLNEGILWALNQPEEKRLNPEDDEETFDSACQKIIVGLLGVADARAQKEKREFKASLERTNPTLADFLRRNHENRELARENREARRRIEELTARITALCEENVQPGSAPPESAGMPRS